MPSRGVGRTSVDSPRLHRTTEALLVHCVVCPVLLAADEVEIKGLTGPLRASEVTAVPITLVP